MRGTAPALLWLPQVSASNPNLWLPSFTILDRSDDLTFFLPNSCLVVIFVPPSYKLARALSPKCANDTLPTSSSSRHRQPSSDLPHRPRHLLTRYTNTSPPAPTGEQPPRAHPLAKSHSSPRARFPLPRVVTPRDFTSTHTLF